ncbi:unnamed protein product [Fusarium graminearum]|uniref:Chromosome 3, complete genome n=1 Tax=Gibberella zeae (strain ATCC MYA-4620 / CBS 123657 / FGSC 9075 / NRRL 31084 / PH-1) TaxID=229533 RepID=A0A098E1C6_GIBZE|nr:unnamed protein product [Fusarium graminearum]
MVKGSGKVEEEEEEEEEEEAKPENNCSGKPDANKLTRHRETGHKGTGHGGQPRATPVEGSAIEQSRAGLSVLFCCAFFSGCPHLIQPPQTKHAHTRESGDPAPAPVPAAPASQGADGCEQGGTVGRYLLWWSGPVALGWTLCRELVLEDIVLSRFHGNIVVQSTDWLPGAYYTMFIKDVFIAREMGIPRRLIARLVSSATVSTIESSLQAPEISATSSLSHK